MGDAIAIMIKFFGARLKEEGAITDPVHQQT